MQDQLRRSPLVCLLLWNLKKRNLNMIYAPTYKLSSFVPILSSDFQCGYFEPVHSTIIESRQNPVSNRGWYRDIIHFTHMIYTFWSAYERNVSH